jgi:hypothetical protein
MLHSTQQRPSRGVSVLIHLTTSLVSQSTSGNCQKHHRKCITLDVRIIASNQLTWTSPSAGRDIVSRLLDKEENARLGSKTGASEVKQHKWFSKINWGLLRNTEPPVSCATWVARLAMAACRFVYYMSPGL